MDVLASSRLPVPGRLRLRMAPLPSSPVIPCPRCQQHSACFVAAPSALATVNYYRCVKCGLVWHFPKIGPPTVTIVGEPPWQAVERWIGDRASARSCIVSSAAAGWRSTQRTAPSARPVVYCSAVASSRQRRAV